MAKKINLLGLSIDNFSLREALLKAETYLKDERINVIQTLSMEDITFMAGDEDKRESFGMVDLQIIGQAEILKAAKVESQQRMREVEENLFLREFIKRLSRNHKKLFLLAKTSDELEQAKKIMEEELSISSLCGQVSLEGVNKDMDSAVNEINSTACDVVISTLSTPEWEEFLRLNKDKLLARIWYGVGSWHISGKMNGISRLFSSLKLKMHLKRYESESEK